MLTFYRIYIIASRAGAKAGKRRKGHLMAGKRARAGTAPESLGGVEPASYLLDAVVRLWRATYQTGNVRLRPWKVTLSSYAALRVISEHPELTLAQLARRNFVRPQTMTRIATELERRGWIERQTQRDDGRALALSLTEAGRAALTEMAAEVDQINDTIKRVLDEAQIDQLNGLLRECARQVEAELGEISARDAP